ncbi:3-isopropylmalate dehydratase small subunit [Pararhodobacter sp. SW119]|uniref:3-isopropylmalate dehydratase small subunit n=1 Tax=Pararhodobacter sp. SW119 TaxID=2780075 RepID=UPI001ADEC699|nr:3-isopropylmalate dehydratase small subunit [Pararhodobacter sp. SW119]
MSGWSRHEGLGVALPDESIDTDQLIPARFMATPRAQGYGRFLLHDLRHDAEGRPLPDFPLNRVPDATILITGRNFGAGSSREAAVYALVDAGIRAVLAPSFGDIFAANAINNGLLPARISSGDMERLTGAMPDRLEIDLMARCVTGGGLQALFELDPVWQMKLVNGWDDIDLTGAHQDDIAAFATADRIRRPWARPAAERSLS